MASPYRIQLPMYDGPLDLLLDLIRKQEIDIHNIPIAQITQQYLEYLGNWSSWISTFLRTLFTWRPR